MSRRKRSKKPGSRPEGSLLRLPILAAALPIAAWTAWTGWLFYKAGVSLYPGTFGEFFRLAASAPGVLAGGLLKSLLLTALLWFLFRSLGGLLLARLGLEGADRAEHGLLASGLGAGAVCLSMLFLGLAGFWRPSALRVLFYAGLAACLGGWFYRHRRKAAEEGEFDLPGKEPAGRPWRTVYGCWGAAAMAVMFLALVLNVLATAAPEIFYDSLVYHLALPRLYLLRGGIVPTPENVYSGIPFMLQMLYGLALSLSDENLAALLHCSFGVAAALALWCWARRRASERTGVLAALLFYLCPVTMYASWNCGVDLGAAFFCMLSFIALANALEDRGGKGRAWSVCAGLLAGAAMGVKYNVFPVGAALVAAHFWFGRREGRPWTDTLWMAVSAGLVLSPWLVKNVFFYGNPLYPFLHNVIGWTAPADWQGFLEAAGSRAAIADYGTWSGMKSILRFPWEVSLGDWPMGDWPGPAYLMLVPWAFLLRWGLLRREGGPPPSWSAAAFLAVFGFAVWCMASSLVRYLVPSLGFIALTAALAADLGGYPAWLRGSGWAVAVFTCLFSFQAAVRQGGLIGQWDVLRGKSSRYEHLTRQHVTYGLPYYAAVDFIDRELPEDAKVLFLGESRAYYCERDYIAATVFDDNPFWEAVRESSDAKELFERVRAMGVTHVFMSARQLLYRKELANLFPRELVRGGVFRQFWARGLDLLFEEREDGGENPRWLTVYALREKPKGDPETFTENPALVVLGYLDRKESPDGG